MIRISRLFAMLILLAASLSAGCKQEQNLMANLLVQPEQAAQLGYDIAWQTHLNILQGQKLRHVEVFDDFIVALRSGNVASVIEASSGRIIWNDSIGTAGERMFRPVRNGEDLIINSETRMYILKIRSGQIVRVIDLMAAVNTPPLIAGQLAVFGTPKGVVFAQHLQSGLEIWKMQTDAAISTDPLMAGNYIIVGNNLGTIAAFTTGGDLLWTRKTHEKISALPVATDLLIYVASEDKSLYAFERSTGKLRWRYLTEEPLNSPPAVIGELLIQHIPGTGTVAIDAFSGQKVWTLPGNIKPIQGKNLQILTLSGDTLAIVRAKDGIQTSEQKLPRVHRVIPERIDGGSLYLVRENGRIMKLNPKN